MTDTSSGAQTFVKIREHVLDRLRKSAAAHGRSLAGEVNCLLDRHLTPEDAAALPEDTRQPEAIKAEAWRICQKEPSLAAEIARLAQSRVKLAGLTTKQAELLDFIQRYASQHDGQTPTYIEMMTGIGLSSKSGVNRLVAGLEERGYLTRTPRAAQSIRLT